MADEDVQARDDEYVDLSSAREVPVNKGAKASLKSKKAGAKRKAAPRGVKGSKKSAKAVAQTPPRSRMADREITFHFHPWKILKGGVLVALLFAVFFLGQLTASPASCAADGVTAAVVADGSDSTSESGSWLSSLVDGIVDSSDGVTTESAKEKTETPGDSEASTKSGDAEAAPEPKEEPKPEPVKEKIITKYSNVKVTLDKPYFKPYDGWGKITGLKYSIVNNEAGTIKPAYFIMTVEGYGDYEKKIILPSKGLTVKAGQTSTLDAVVPSGFAYSQATAGDLSKVQVKLLLFDNNDKLMTSTQKNLNLKG